MTAAVSTQGIKNAAGTTFNVAMLDASGTGVGPWNSLSGAMDASGNIMTPAKDTTVASAVTALGLVATAANQTTELASLATLVTASATAAKDGTDATGVTAPTGAVGIRGWLSSIYNKLATSIVAVISPYPGTVTQTIVTLAAATTASLVGANATRKSLKWMNIGANPVTVVPGVSPAVAGSGMNYASGATEKFDATAVPTNAFQAISTAGTTLIVWETN